MDDFIDRLESLTLRPACFEHHPVAEVDYRTLWLLRFVASALIRLKVADARLSPANADSLVLWAHDSVGRLYAHAGPHSHTFESVDLRLLGTVKGLLTGDAKADKDITAMVPNSAAWARSIAVSEGAGPFLLDDFNDVVPDSPRQLQISFGTPESRSPSRPPLLPRPLPLTAATNIDNAVLVTDWAPAPGYDSAASTAIRKRLVHTFSPVLKNLKRNSKHAKVDSDVDVRDLGSHQRGAAVTVTLDYLVVFNGDSPDLGADMPPDVADCHAALELDPHAHYVEFAYDFADLDADLQLSRHTLIAPDEGIRCSIITFRWYTPPDEDEHEAEPVNQHYVRVNVFYSWKDTAGAAEYCLTSSPVALESFCLHLAEKHPELQLSSAGLCKVNDKGKVTVLKTKDEFELFARCDVTIWQSQLALATPDLPFVPYLTLDGRYVPPSAFSIGGWVFDDADELMDTKPLSVPLFAPTPSSTPQHTTPKTGSKRDTPPSSSSGSGTPAAASYRPPSTKSRVSSKAASTTSKKTSKKQRKKSLMDVDDDADAADEEQSPADSSSSAAAPLPSRPAPLPHRNLRATSSFPRSPTDKPLTSAPFVPPGGVAPAPPVAPALPTWARRLKAKFPRARLPSFGVGGTRTLGTRSSFGM
ncbi:hypothetical protein JCM9279_006527 [Rhodotorula babjevae]